MNLNLENIMKKCLYCLRNFIRDNRPFIQCILKKKSRKYPLKTTAKMIILRFKNGFKWINRYKNQLSAKRPSTLVRTIWPIVPTVITTAPLIRLFGERENTLPPNSPIRFGVKTAHVKPQKTDSTAFHVVITSIFWTRNFHLRASRNQFRNIIKKRVEITKTTLSESREFKSCLKSWILLLLFSLL